MTRPEDGSSEGSARHVLVVDDDPGLGRIYRRVLEGHLSVVKVTVVERSQDAREVAERAAAANEPVGLAFVDFDFPSGPDGIEVVRGLHGFDDDMELVLCSSLAEHVAARVSQDDVLGERVLLLKKPFSAVEVRQMAVVLFEKRRMRRWMTSHVQRLEEIDRLKDELLSTVNHELRTPLTSMRGFAELLLVRDFPREQQQEFIRVILAESQRLERLVTDLLDQQRLERGLLEYNFERVSEIAAVVQEAARPFQLGAGENHRVEIRAEADLPVVKLDTGRFRQVVANLLSNAIKFSPEGGAVEVLVRAAQGSVELVVKDGGIGIAEHELPQLFQRFYRIDNSATRRIGGSGLGLSLVAAIVTAHGGRVSVESEPGKGSAFTASFPAEGS